MRNVDSLRPRPPNYHNTSFSSRMEFTYTTTPRKILDVHLPSYNSLYGAFSLWIFGSLTNHWDIRIFLNDYILKNSDVIDWLRKI